MALRLSRARPSNGAQLGTDEPIRVLVADAHPAIRAGVRLALAGHGFAVRAEASDAAGAVEAALRERPDVCLLDSDMAGGGIAAAAAIVARLPRTAVVIFASSSNGADLVEAIRVGASGYLPKDMDPTRLPHALRGVVRGEAALPRALVGRLLDELRGGAARRRPAVRAGRADLTNREWEVFELMRQDLTTAQIAQRLYVSPGTVRTHVAAVLKKLGVPDRGAAVRLLER